MCVAAHIGRKSFQRRQCHGHISFIGLRSFMNGQPLQWCKPLVHSFRDAYRLLCGCGTARNDNIEQPTRERERERDAGRMPPVGGTLGGGSSRKTRRGNNYFICHFPLPMDSANGFKEISSRSADSISALLRGRGGGGGIHSPSQSR